MCRRFAAKHVTIFILLERTTTFFPHENIFIHEKKTETITIHRIGMHFICTIERCPVILFPMNLHFMSKKLLNGTNTDTYMRQLFLFSEITPMFM